MTGTVDIGDKYAHLPGVVIMQHTDGYGAVPMDLHVSPQGYHPYFRYLDSSMVMKAGGDDGSGAAVVQSRILEMRKEKSRDAARSRRGKENYEFYELAKMLPLPAAITSQLDKASIIRLTISYLKLRDFSAHGDRPWSRDGTNSIKTIKGGPIRGRSMATVAMDIFEQHQGTHILQSLDGFAFALASDGRFLYVSETVSIYLGLSQVEMTGSSVFDYIHQQDHAELAEQLGINLAQSQSLASPGSAGSDDGSASNCPGTPTSLDRPAPIMTLSNSTAYKGLERSFCIRMKSTLTKRGCHFKSSGYRVVLVLCHLRPQYSFSPSRKQPQTILGMVALAIALPPPSVNEVRLESDMFVTRLTFDFRIAHCEPRVSELLDFTAEELTGRNMYALCHGQDVQKLRKCHIDLINKGQVMSGYYRIMNKNGGYTWLQTCATVICTTKNSEEQSIICVNYVLSGIEYENCIMDYSQLRGVGDLKPDDPSNSERGSTPDNEGRDDSSRDADPRPSPKSHESQSLGQDNSNTEHLTQLSSATKLDPLRSSTKDGCRVREQTSPSFDVDEKLPATTDMVSQRYGMDKPDAVIISERSRKRPLGSTSDASIVDSADCRSPKSRPESVSSLQPMSPQSVSGGSGNEGTPFLANGLGGATTTATPAEPCPSPAPSQDESRDGDDGLSRPWKVTPIGNYNDTSATNGGGGLTVRELEDAMKKHLPGADISQRGSVCLPPQRSTIQWIGGPQTGLPASTLLRQLYVDRESVIRSGSHVTSRPTYYGDVPTPPGGATDPAYADHTQFMIPSKVGADSYGVLPAYSSGYVESFSAVTPPASVSPRDKLPPGLAESPAFSEAAAAAAAAAMPHMRHYVADLPLKPQVLVHPSGLESAYAAAAAAQHPHGQQALQEQQLYPHPSSFHLYHHGKPHHPAANGSWYSQPSS